MRKIMIGLMCLSLYTSTQATDVEVAPNELVKQKTDEVIAGLEKNKATYKQDSAKLYAFVEETVLAHFDFDRMAKLVLARNWKKASDEQKPRFTEAFKGMLVRTYAKSLTEYDGQKIKYLPFKGVDKETGKAQVKTEIAATGEPIPINYLLIKNDEGQWKVIDLAIDGISLVTNYRSSFMRKIRKQGIDGLIEDLESKNEESKTDKPIEKKEKAA